MRAEDTLQCMADFYPTIFPTRKHALNHLFCVIGNGYEWENGELVDHEGKYEKRYRLIIPIEKAEFVHENHWNEVHEFYKKLQRLDDKKIPMKYNFTWYPLNKKFSYLYDYPDNIKPDWAALLEECKKMLIADGIAI